MSFADLELSESAFLNPGQLQWSDAKSDLKVESSPVPRSMFYADPGSYAFYNDSNGSPTIDTQLFASQPQPHAQPSEMLTSAPQQVVYFDPSAENEMEMDGDSELRYPGASPSLPPSGVPTSVQPSVVMSSSSPAFGAPVPFLRPGSSSPPGLTSELNEDLGSETGEGDACKPSDGGDDDGEFMPRNMSHSRT